MLLEAARTQTQAVRNETLTISPACPIARLDDSNTGERRAVISAQGDLEIIYCATVDVAAADHSLAGAEAWPVRDLPPDALSFLMPSRYCPSDRLHRFVESEFGALAGGEKATAITDWVRNNLEYSPRFTDSQTTAIDTMIDRVGVCRDFSHLAITCLRAANIPARAVSAYAWRLTPPDMHAVVEVFLGGRWRMIDPTGLAPLEGLVRVATGRDAGDIAFMTIFGEAQLIAQTFSVTEVARAAP